MLRAGCALGELLRRHVMGRAKPRWAAGEQLPRVVGGTRQIDQVHAVLGVEHQRLRADVAVDDRRAERVQVVDRAGGVGDHRHRLPLVASVPPRAHQLHQSLAVDLLEHEGRVELVEQLRDARVTQATEQPAVVFGGAALGPLDDHRVVAPPGAEHREAQTVADAGHVGEAGPLGARCRWRRCRRWRRRSLGHVRLRLRLGRWHVRLRLRLGRWHVRLRLRLGRWHLFVRLHDSASLRSHRRWGPVSGRSESARRRRRQGSVRRPLPSAP